MSSTNSVAGHRSPAGHRRRVPGVAVRASVSAATATVGEGSLDGSAVPMGTGIPFALAVLAVLSTHLPSALRALPPTPAAADDRGPARSPTV
ncbi:Na+/H+ antiporter NhaA [Streptomyces sp. NBC_00841]|uniref:Na+/H+ antiporter NhaA n=1 Tax=Streptomyces sp. NBC_00841 TaxID=2975847 RepID=UPI003FA36DAA